MSLVSVSETAFESTDAEVAMCDSVPAPSAAGRAMRESESRTRWLLRSKHLLDTGFAIMR